MMRTCCLLILLAGPVAAQTSFRDKVLAMLQSQVDEKTAENNSALDEQAALDLWLEGTCDNDDDDVKSCYVAKADAAEEDMNTAKGALNAARAKLVALTKETRENQKETREKKNEVENKKHDIFEFHSKYQGILMALAKQKSSLSAATAANDDKGTSDAIAAALSKLKGDIETSITEQHAEHNEEVTALKNDIDALNTEIQALETAQDERDLKTSEEKATEATELEKWQTKQKEWRITDERQKQMTERKSATKAIVDKAVARSTAERETLDATLSAAKTASWNSFLQTESMHKPRVALTATQTMTSAKLSVGVRKLKAALASEDSDLLRLVEGRTAAIQQGTNAKDAFDQIINMLEDTLTKLIEEQEQEKAAHAKCSNARKEAKETVDGATETYLLNREILMQRMVEMRSAEGSVNHYVAKQNSDDIVWKKLFDFRRGEAYLYTKRATTNEENMKSVQNLIKTLEAGDANPAIQQAVNMLGSVESAVDSATRANDEHEASSREEFRSTYRALLAAYNERLAGINMQKSKHSNSQDTMGIEETGGNLAVAGNKAMGKFVHAAKALADAAVLPTEADDICKPGMTREERIQAREAEIKALEAGYDAVSKSLNN